MEFNDYVQNQKIIIKCLLNHILLTQVEEKLQAQLTESIVKYNLKFFRFQKIANLNEQIK